MSGSQLSFDNELTTNVAMSQTVTPSSNRPSTMSSDADIPSPLNIHPPAAPEPPHEPDGFAISRASAGPPRDADGGVRVVSRGGSKRRKPAGGSISSSQMPPMAPEVPTSPRGPPISYREPYSNDHLGVKTFADRARDLAEEGTPLPSGNTPEPSREGPYGKPSRHSRSASHAYRDQRAEDRVQVPFGDDIETGQPEPYSSTRHARTVSADYGHTQRGSVGDAQPARSDTVRSSANPQKVDWAVDHSPLQRLENDLLTKEKKRARVQQAEQRVREKERIRKQRESQVAEASQAEDVSRAVPTTPGAQVSVEPALGRSASNRRVVSDPHTPSAKTAENRMSRIPRPVDIMAGHGLASIGRPTAHTARASLDSSLSRQLPDASGVHGIQQDALGPRRRSVDDRGVRFPQNPVEASVSASRPGPNEPSRAMPSQPAGRSSDDSGLKQGAVAAGAAGAAAGASLTAAHHGHGHKAAPKYEVPPQTAAGGKARQLIGFGGIATEPATASAGGQHHFPHLHRKQPETSPQGQQPIRYLDEWRQAETACLLLSDLTARTTPKSEQGQLAWWESPNSGRKRDSSMPSQQQSDAVYFDGANEDVNQPTKFDPPLYLKCGPLLRYTGLKREPARSRDQATPGREFWRGSVMIVTVDAESEYKVVPTLRLFHQHLDLLPPPPSQISEGEGPLPSEYVDPVAGLPKLARDGSTVYVKPAEDFDEGVDYSHDETDGGLYEKMRTANVPTAYGRPDDDAGASPIERHSGANSRKAKSTGRFREVKGIRLHAERGLTFWRFNLQVELGDSQSRIAYRINKGASTGFWVPGRGQTMNIMFHSCNGFSSSVDPNEFSGPDPMWRDVLNSHQTKPFHVMIGGGDQIYNDRVSEATTLFRNWLGIKTPHGKRHAEFTTEIRDELESFYLDRYARWFSQGLFGMAKSQIPMVNIWDDHDIIDGYGSYSDAFQSTAIFCGLGNVAYKYYMLFQHQSVPDELEADEPSWLLGAGPGPYINFHSRSVFLSLGKHVSFLGLDCRTERMREEVLSQHTYDLVLDRCRREIVNGQTKHLIVLLGVPIAYPRLVWLENILTSRAMDPVKALGRLGMFGNLMNKFDGGYEILDDLDDHWTATHHKDERQYFIQELQDLAAERSVRITILSGDVHLAAVGQFYSNRKLGISKDQDHRYMPNVISSAIVNTPPPDMMADVLNRRDKVHHLDQETDEDMIPMFSHDVDGKKRNNKKLLPRRNWCSICEYHPGSTPPPTPPLTPTPPETPMSGFSDDDDDTPPRRSLSLGRDIRPGNLLRRLSLSNEQTKSPEFGSGDDPEKDSYFPPNSDGARSFNKLNRNVSAPPISIRPLGQFHRRPTDLSEKAAKKGGADAGGEISLENGLDIRLNCEIKKGDPLGSTESYRLLVPALYYTAERAPEPLPRRPSMVQRLSSLRGAPFMKQKNRDSISSFASQDGPVGPDVAAGPAKTLPATFPPRPNLPAGYSASVESLEQQPPQRPRRNSLLQRFGSLRDRIPQIGKPKQEVDNYSHATNDEYAPNDDAGMMRSGRKSISSRPPISGTADPTQRPRRASLAERIGSIGRRLSQSARPKQQQYYSDEDDYTGSETESELDYEEDYIGSGDLTRPGRQPMAPASMGRGTAVHQTRQVPPSAKEASKRDEGTPDPFKARPKVAMSPPPQIQQAQGVRSVQPQQTSAYGSTDAMVGSSRQPPTQQTRAGQAAAHGNRRSGAVFNHPVQDISDDDGNEGDYMDSIDDLDPHKQVPHKRRNVVNNIAANDAAGAGHRTAAAQVAAPKRKDMSKFFGDDDTTVEEARRRSMGSNRNSRGYDGIDAYDGNGGKKWWKLG